jgi:predicted  nucleic acid-binding Zn-ribbon protein
MSVNLYYTGMKRNLIGIAAVLLAAAAATAAARAQAQTPDVLTELLAEVRGLRAAMEQMASAGPRVELALGRLQLQEQRVNNLARRLDTARANVLNAQREVAQHDEQIRNFESSLRGVTDAQERQDIEHQMEQLKRMATAAQAEIQRLTTEEAQINNELATEQGRWAELNARVEELERTLGRR